MKISIKGKTRIVIEAVIIWDVFKIADNFNELFMNIVPHSKISPKETIEINVDEINRLVLRKAVKKSRHHLGIKIIKSTSKVFIRNKEFRY